MIWLCEQSRRFGEGELRAMCRVVAPSRRPYIAQYRQLGDRVNAALAYLMLRIAMWQQEGDGRRFELQTGPSGKPDFAGRREGMPQFNLSHSREAVAVALAPVAVGVDVEEAVAYDASWCRSLLTDEERREVEGAAEPDMAFTRLWTQKEAVAKRLGCGIACDVAALLQRPEAGSVASQRRGTRWLSVCPGPIAPLYSLTREDVMAYVAFFQQLDGATSAAASTRHTAPPARAHRLGAMR